MHVEITKQEFKEIANILGIKEYPGRFEEIYKNLKDEKTLFCDISVIEKYDKEFSILQEHLDLVKQGAKEVLEDKALYLYGRTLCEYIKTSSTWDTRHTPLPELDGSAARDVFGVLLIFTLIPESVEFFRNHGFSDDEIKLSYRDIRKNMNEMADRIGRPALTFSYYNWNLIYIFGEMFYHNGFEYQFRKLDDEAVVLKNKKDGSFKILVTKKTFHKSGRVLGSAGAEDADGSFEADFAETNKAFIGREAIHARVSSETAEFNKEEWECVLRPGDEILAVHIPGGTDLSPEFFTQSFKEGFEIALKRFPERDPKFLACFSWLMDPTVAVLTEGSKLAGFANAFIPYPLLSSGREVRFWVFPDPEAEDLYLPEDTSLRRKLKALFLAGGHIYYTAGICTKVLRPED